MLQKIMQAARCKDTVITIASTAAGLAVLTMGWAGWLPGA